MHCELSSDSTKAFELEISVRIVAELAILRPHSFAVILANEESHLFDDLLRFDITSALQLNIERCLICGSELVAIITILAAIIKALLHDSKVVIGLRAERVPIFYLNLIVVSSLVWWELYSIGDVGRLWADQLLFEPQIFFFIRLLSDLRRDLIVNSALVVVRQ